MQKGVYPYKYMGDWEKFNKISLLEKEDFYSHLNIEDITDADYARVYHELHVQGDTLLLADVFENFRNMCLKVYELDAAKFLSPPGLA